MDTMGMVYPTPSTSASALIANPDIESNYPPYPPLSGRAPLNTRQSATAPPVRRRDPSPSRPHNEARTSARRREPSPFDSATTPQPPRPKIHCKRRSLGCTWENACRSNVGRHERFSCTKRTQEEVELALQKTACPLCSKVYARTDTLRRHMEEDHGWPPARPR
jgi:uncharacterized C2H2 Zn-finger protein